MTTDLLVVLAIFIGLFLLGSVRRGRKIWSRVNSLIVKIGAAVGGVLLLVLNLLALAFVTFCDSAAEALERHYEKKEGEEE